MRKESDCRSRQDAPELIDFFAREVWMRSFLLITLCSLVVGCTSLPSGHKKSEVADQVLSAELVPCADPVGPEIQMTPIYVPLVEGAIQFLLDIGFEYRKQQLLDLKKRATPDPMVVRLPPKKFKELDENHKGQCLKLWRSSRPVGEEAYEKLTKEDKTPGTGLVAEFRIARKEGLGNAVIIEPRSIRLSNTVAFTRTPEKADDKPTATLVFAFALSALSKEGQDGLRTWKPIGAADMQAPSLALDDKVTIDCGKKSLEWCQRLQPLGSTGDDAPVVLSVGVTEIGEIGIDVDKRLMIAKTLKDTIGAGLVEAIGKID